MPSIEEPKESARGVHGIGKAVELLVAAYCMLASSGELNVSTSFVDDQGVDLVFNRWGRTATLAIQIKSRTTEAAAVKQRTFSADVKRSTFQPRRDLYLLFTVVDRPTASLGQMWLVPSTALESKNPGKEKIRFQANVNPRGEGQWDQYSVSHAELPSRILLILDELAVFRSIE